MTGPYIGTVHTRQRTGRVASSRLHGESVVSKAASAAEMQSYWQRPFRLGIKRVAEERERQENSEKD